MSWRIKLETEGAETRIVGRDAEGSRHDAVMTAGDPPRLTLLGNGPHHPCRLADAAGVEECLVSLGPAARREIAARRELPVDAPLNRDTRLQAAAELDRLSGVVFDELMDRGAHPGEVGLAPILRLRAGGEGAAVWLGTEAEMRADFAAELRRSRGIRGGDRGIQGGLRGIDEEETVMIEALAITAFAPSDEGEGAPPAPAGLRRLDLAGGAATGAGVVRIAGAVIVIDHGWLAAAEGAGLRLRRTG
jgi:hypothetical protein